MAAIRQDTRERLERADGAARIVLARRDNVTAIADLYQRAPCRVLFPDVDAGDPLTAALLTTSGGLTDGDRISLSLSAGEGAAATITTQAAEKIYRSAGDPCCVSAELDLAPGAAIEWLMQETILFNGARLSRRLEADVPASAQLLAVESLVFGRTAMGEAFRHGYVRDVWRIKREGRPVWVDALKLDGDVGAARAKPFGFGTAVACATIVYVGADAARWLDTAREAVAERGAEAAATSFDGLLVVRILADDASAMRGAVARCVTRLRSAALGRPARMPRLWSL
jgi:urease accessory protein